MGMLKLFWKKINIKDYDSKNPMIRNYAERQAINAPFKELQQIL